MIHVEKNVFIPLSDGVNIAADIYFPEGDDPTPAILCYYPYRKDDFIGIGHDYTCRYFAERGYAHLMVDFRGTGSSEGVAWEAMDPREDKDAAEIVEWIAKQPWCDGNVGMWGISYGGMTSLKAASQRPPALKAIIPIFGSLDAYQDIYSPGGCLTCLTLGDWGTVMVPSAIMPPTYPDPEGRWYELWMERLDSVDPYILGPYAHPTYDEYWKARITPVENIECPTFIIGAWRDIFPEAMVRAYEKISAPKKLVMGPWTHVSMDHSPLETWDYQPVMKRWFDRWLMDEQNGVAEEPPVTLFIQGEKRWRNEARWPIERTEAHTLYLSQAGGLNETVETESGSVRYLTDPTVGYTAGLWDANSRAMGTPIEQSPDDLRSLTFTTEPLEERLEITGSPEAVLYVTLETGDEIHLVAKLSDVGTDGSSSLITTGWLKGSHRESHESPTPLKKGVLYEFRIPIWVSSYAIEQGHRLRLSVACSDFPRIWPTSVNPEISLHHGGETPSAVRIPVVPLTDNPLPEPEISRPDPGVDRDEHFVDGEPFWLVEHDHVKQGVSIQAGDWARVTTPHGKVKINSWDTRTKAIVEKERPDGARIEGTSDVDLDMAGAGHFKVETSTLISMKRCVVTAKIYWNGRLCYDKVWRK